MYVSLLNESRTVEMKLRDVVLGVVGSGNFGRLEFFLRPEKRDGFGGPFNGQKFRQRIFFDLMYAFPIKALVETGMYRGTTTALLGATALPVYSAEIHPQYFAFSRMRFLFGAANVHPFNGDSRAFLRALVADPTVPKDDVFFYLDAHWEDDLPLREELELIFSGWSRPLVLIDDFEVPGTDYGFDDYGPEKTLNLSYIAPVVGKNAIAVFFPVATPLEETGAKRGTVVLCRETQSSEVEALVHTLVRHHPDERR